MDVKLTIYDDKRQIFSQVVSLPCVVGRSKQSNIAIVHPLISRQHCEIYEDGGFIKTRDLGSLNGTFYRGERIGRGVVIPFGDAFSIGALYFLIEAARSETTKLVVPASAESGFQPFAAPSGVPATPNRSEKAPNPPGAVTRTQKNSQSDVLLTSRSSENDVVYRLADDDLRSNAPQNPRDVSKNVGQPDSVDELEHLDDLALVDDLPAPDDDANPNVSAQDEVLDLADFLEDDSSDD